MPKRFRLRSRDAAAAEGMPESLLPVVWLLGKTGAGKTSLVRALTEQTDAEIGNGFQPCTRSAKSYDFPPDGPLVRFLDTRGLGEAGYDPADDLAECLDRSHVVLVVCRLDDPVQGDVADALADVARQDKRMRAILVLTGEDLLPDESARDRARRTITARMNRAAGRDLPVATVTFVPGGGPQPEGLEDLRRLLLDALPAAGLLLAADHAATAEEAAFQAVRRRVLFYAGLAGSTDVAPVFGAVSVPATQIAMLRELGQRYDMPWNRKTSAAFLGAFGIGMGARFTASYGLRQLAKLIPVYGQTIGAAAAGSVSFATTYALGRAAAYFLYTYASGNAPSEADLRKIYTRAFDRSSPDETD
ncbi:YcjF family protein [Tropicimonas isoalkanivorans]|uniref:50S ribosome-binding GTPase n=1 Tax=Tropicimonas isoalkanivorans TaxID=441112 RepID=A0A1I1MLU5_9RHOB|nr:GTPase [Tropicimonas isoalkanivorans]SFC85802.1 50S ribosome-binding GTPase [Tropicimonas isoalkanivorans]